MKELKMFPQITEETEENLLNLEEEPKSPPYSSTPPLNPSSSSSDSPEAPSSPNHENQVPCLLPTITTEDVDRTVSPIRQSSPPPDEEYSSPPPRVRMRSLSGGAHRLAPALPPPAGRHRRQSGDDVLSRVGRTATLFEQFRPRSKSDSKGCKRPTFLTTLKNSLLGSHHSSVHRKTSLDSGLGPQENLEPDVFRPQRPRSGSETKGGTMSKMIDLFRSRSHSVSYDSRGKMVPPTIFPNEKLKRRPKRPYVNTFRSLDAHKGDSYACHSEDEAGESRFDFGSLDEEKLIPSFFSARTCYDAMPKSGKVIVLSTDLLVKNAFSCLVTNEIRAAPLWDSSSQTFVGMLTISDFINVLRHYYYSSQDDIKDIENQKIAFWRKITDNFRPIVKIPPNESLVNATKLLIEERIHRLPVYDERRNSVLFVISRKRLLQYLYNNLIEKFGKTYLKVPFFWKRSLGDLRSQLGTWENIATVSVDTKVIEALDLFCERKVSALPVMDADGKLVDIFAKFDVFALAKEQTYDNLDMTVAEALDKAEVHEDVYGCTVDEPLGTVIDRFVAAKVHRLVIVDEQHAVIGMLSLSDLLNFLIVQPLDDSAIVSDIIEETPEGAMGGQEDSSVFLSGSGPSSLGNLQKSSSLEKQDSSDLSEDFVKVHLETDTPEPLSEASICEDDP